MRIALALTIAAATTLCTTRVASAVVIFEDTFNGAPYMNSTTPIYDFAGSVWRKALLTDGTSSFTVNQAGTANGRLSFAIPVNDPTYEITATLPEPAVLGPNVGDFVRYSFNVQFVSSIVGPSNFAQFRTALTNSGGVAIPFGGDGYGAEVGTDRGIYLQLGASAGLEDPAMILLNRDPGSGRVLSGANSNPPSGQLPIPPTTSVPSTLFGNTTTNRAVQFEMNRVSATQTRYEMRLDNNVVASSTVANSVANWVTSFDQISFSTGFNQGLDVLVDNVRLESSTVPLRLVVNKVTGAVSIRNDSGNAISFDYYQITSAGGALRTANGQWNSLNDQNLNPVNSGTAPGESWDESAGASATLLSEVFLLGQTSIAPGGSVALGSAYNAAIFGANDGDLTFSYSAKGQPTLSPGKVLYTTAVGVSGDYNNDGVVNAADYTMWRDALGTSTTLPNDTTPGSVVQADYNVWVANYGQSASAATAVPEPAAGACLAMLVTLAAMRGRND
jgi:hypothetical protein